MWESKYCSNIFCLIIWPSFLVTCFYFNFMKTEYMSFILLAKEMERNIIYIFNLKIINDYIYKREGLKCINMMSQHDYSS